MGKVQNNTIFDTSIPPGQNNTVVKLQLPMSDLELINDVQEDGVPLSPV